jgi:hypothetical protein
MAIRMQQRRGTAAQWISLNDGDGPILGAGEIGFESDTGKFKIGDGTNHWIDLDYFVDSSDLGTSLDGYIPTSLLGANDGVAQLNSSGKLVSTQIPNVDEITQDAIDSALVGGDGITKTYSDVGNTITIDVDITASGGLKIDTGKLTVDPLVTQLRVANVTDTEIGYLDGVTSSIQTQLGNKQDKVTDVSDTEIGYLNGVTSSIQTQLDNKLASADLTEAAQDAVNTAIVAGTGLDKTYDDAGNTITLDIDSTVATLTGTQTLTNKTLTSPAINTPTGITKSDVGLANVDNTTDANKPVSTATQTALDLKAPLASPTFTGTVTLPSGTVTSTMIADGTILNEDINSSAAIALSKLATDPLARANHTGSQAASTISDFNEAAQDAIGSILGTGLSYNDAGPGIGINNAALTDYLLDGVSGSSYGLIGTSAYLDIKNTNAYNKEIELDIAAVESKLETDGFAKLAAPAFTGTATAVNLTISGDLTVNGTTTNLNSTSLVVEDKNVILGDTATPTDTTADGGGITLKGTTDKTLNWVDATDAWTSSEDFNLLTGKVYEINGTSVLSGTTLGSGVTGSSLTSVGTITSGTWTGTTIAIANGGTGATTASNAAAALLPAQTSNSGKYLTTDGSGTLSWGTVSGYSAPTLGSTSIASGATVTTIAGLTLTSPVATTSFTLNDRAELRLADTDSSHYVGFKSPATVSTNRIWTLPSVDGTAGQVLSTDGSATLSWATAAGGGGADEVKLVMGAY